MKKRNLFFFGIIGIVICISPITLFLLNFKNQCLSTNLSDWGAFGSFIGGVFGSIISLFSLLILGYITYIVSRNSNEENKNLFFLKKRIEAYDELLKYMPKLYTFPKTFHKLNAITRFNSLDTNRSTTVGQRERYSEIMKIYEFLIEFQFYLKNFPSRYSHLFKYNFKTEDYRLIIDYCQKFSKSFEYYIDIKDLVIDESHDLDIESMSSLLSSLNTLISNLKLELQ